MLQKKKRRSFALFAFAAGVLLVLLEIDSYRRDGEVSWFWLFVAGLAIVLGLVDMTARREPE